jgi:hypothetical protein
MISYKPIPKTDLQASLEESIDNHNQTIYYIIE